MGVDRETLARTLRPENSPGFLLWQAANQWQRRLRAVLEPLGITHVQFVLLAGLAWLEHRGEAPTQVRLAAFCRTDAMMTSQVVRAIEAAGLVQRQRHPSDSRARLLKLTAKGAEVLNQAMPAVLAADAAHFAALEDRAGFIDALRRLIRGGLGPTPR